MERKAPLVWLRNMRVGSEISAEGYVIYLSIWHRGVRKYCCNAVLERTFEQVLQTSSAWSLCYRFSATKFVLGNGVLTNSS